MPDFELICINDGSTDRTADILLCSAEGDPRILVIDQENAGASAARNRGVEAARGAYLLFFDDDDLMDERMLELLSGKMDEQEAEICVTGGYKLDMQTGDQVVVPSFLRMEYVPSSEVFSPYDVGMYLLNFSSFHICNKMYRTDFVRKQRVRFRPQRVAEDALFYVEALLAATRITAVDEHLFVYRKNTGNSVSDSMGLEDVESGFRMTAAIKQLMEKRGMYEGSFKQSFANRALTTLIHYRNQAANYSSFLEWYRLFAKRGLEDFDLLGHDSAFFYSEGAARQLDRLVSSADVNDYLFDLYRTTRQRANRLSSKSAQYKARVRELKQRLQGMEKKAGEASSWKGSFKSAVRTLTKR